MEQSSFGRLVGVLVSPTKTFEAISAKPTWVVALVALVVIGLLGGVLMKGKIDWAEVTREGLEAQGRDVPEDQLEQIIDFQEKAGPVFMIGGALLGQPLISLLLALVFMVLFKMLGGDLNFVKSFSVLVHSMMPRAVLGLLSIPVILGKDEFGFEELRDGSVLTSNLGALAPEDASAATTALLSSVDLFSIWTLVLLIIGYRVVGKVSKAAAAGGVIVLWLLYVLGKVGLSSLQG